MTSALPTPIELFGVKIHPVAESKLVATLVDWAEMGHRKRAYYVNVHAMNLAWEQPEFRTSLNGADLVYCDGYGVKWGAALQGIGLPDRMTPPDWIDGFLQRIESAASLFLLGDENGVARACAEAMIERHPAIRVVGSHHGFFDLEGDENEEVVDEIRRSAARVLLVGMGMPRQEFWIDNNIERLEVRVALPVGALFRWYSGVEPRPPRVVTSHGLEWFWRLSHHPVLLFNRYMTGNFKFLARVLGASRNN